MTVAQKIFLGVCAVLATIVFVGCAPTAAYVAARHIETGIATFVDTGADIWHQYSHAHLENCKDGCADLACFNTCASQWESGTVVHADAVIVKARDAVHEYDSSLTVTDAVKSKDFSAAIAKLVMAITEMVNVLNGYGLTLSMLKVL